MSVFNIGLYMCEYNALGSVPSTRKMAAFCTHHITFAIVNLINKCKDVKIWEGKATKYQLFGVFYCCDYSTTYQKCPE